MVLPQYIGAPSTQVTLRALLLLRTTCDLWLTQGSCFGLLPSSQCLLHLLRNVDRTLLDADSHFYFSICTPTPGDYQPPVPTAVTLSPTADRENPISTWWPATLWILTKLSCLCCAILRKLRGSPSDRVYYLTAVNWINWPFNAKSMRRCAILSISNIRQTTRYSVVYSRWTTSSLRRCCALNLQAKRQRFRLSVF